MSKKNLFPFEKSDQEKKLKNKRNIRRKSITSAN